MENNIKNVLKEKGISQKDIAKQIGISEVGMSKAVNGSASDKTINKIAEVINVSPDILKTDILVAKYSADKTPLKLGELEIPCYVLENGQRVFSGRGVQKAIGYKSKSGQWMKPFCNLDGLSSKLCAGEDSIQYKLSNPISFKRSNAGGSQSVTYGYEVTLLIDICSAIIDANRAGIFNDEVMVRNADIIIRAVAKVGIIALVDEATGYNKEKNRAKDELQQFLSQFLSQEASKWVKTFDDDFFEMIYRMRGWNWNMTNKRPGVVGLWINNIVYERLAPQILNELNKLNPKNENGNRRYKNHQFLSEAIGHPRLKEHLAGVMAVGALSNNNWNLFMSNLDKVYPRQNQQTIIDFNFDK